MGATDNPPVLAFISASEWETWLERHQADSQGVWIKIAKKKSGVGSVTYDEALDVALCFGWIDAKKDRLDESHWLQRFTARRPRSKWSAANRERVNTLLRQGRMRPEGIREMERAKADGRWETAYAGQRTATVPEDLQHALEESPAAASFFSNLDRANRYAILYRIADAKRPQTRARRVAQFVEMLARHETVHPSKVSAKAPEREG